MNMTRGMRAVAAVAATDKEGDDTAANRSVDNDKGDGSDGTGR